MITKLSAFKAFIFDLDGVLIDTEPFHFATWQQLAIENGMTYNEVAAAMMRGKTRNESLMSLFQYNNEEVDSLRFERMLARKNELFLAEIKNLSPNDLLEGSKELLLYLQKQNFKIGLASSSKNAPFLLEKTEIAPFFEVIITGADIQYSKPHPEIFLLCAEQLGVEPSDCVVIEDSIAGVTAAHHAKMFCIKVGQGRSDLQADIEVDSLIDIVFD